MPERLDDPEQALQRTVAGALASDADDRLLQVALAQYPAQAPAIAITYGHLELFRAELARFGPQVVPIVAAYQRSLTTPDALQIAGQAVHAAGQRLAGDDHVQDLTPLSPEERGLLALLKMRDEGNAFVGQWEITMGGEARRVPSRVVTLGGPELLLGGLTALERDLVQRKPIDWQTYGLAAVDIAAIGSGAALLRFARTAAGGVTAARAAAGTEGVSGVETAAGAAEGMTTAGAAAETTTLRSGALAAAEVLGINAVRVGLPVGLVALMALHPAVFTHYAWILAQSLGLRGMVGPLVGWSLVILPLSFLLSWLLLSCVRCASPAGSALAPRAAVSAWRCASRPRTIAETTAGVRARGPCPGARDGLYSGSRGRHGPRRPVGAGSRPPSAPADLSKGRAHAPISHDHEHRRYPRACRRRRIADRRAGAGIGGGR